MDSSGRRLESSAADRLDSFIALSKSSSPPSSSLPPPPPLPLLFLALSASRALRFCPRSPVRSIRVPPGDLASSWRANAAARAASCAEIFFELPVLLIRNPPGEDEKELSLSRGLFRAEEEDLPGSRTQGSQKQNNFLGPGPRNQGTRNQPLGRSAPE